MIQNIVVFLIVAAAAVYLGRLLWASLSGKKGCGCSNSGGCSKAAASPQQPAGGLIQISLNGSSGSSNGMRTYTAKPPKPSGTSSEQ